MKKILIKIDKTTRSNSKTHYIFLNENVSDWEIQDAVETFCADDIAGSNYGYSFEWSRVNIPAVIKEQTEKRLVNLRRQREILENEIKSFELTLS